jgi:lipopolysaccharide transport system permease protein
MAVVTVEPTTGWRSLRLREVIDSRELLYFLAWRDVKVRYRQTVLGVAWVMLQPLLLMGVLYVLFARVAGVGSEGLPYWLFALVALVPWTMFSQSVADAALSLVASSNLVSKVYFPRLLVPIASVGSHVLDLAIGLVMVLILVASVGPGLNSRIVFLPLFILLALAATLGFGVLLAALNVRYRDVRYVVPFLIQLLLFISPVAYSSAEIGGGARSLYAINPMAGVIEGFRWALLGVSRDPTAVILLSAASTTVLLAGAIFYFKQVERSFADVI